MVFPFSVFRVSGMALALLLAACAGEVYEIKPGGERVTPPERTPEERVAASLAVAEAFHGMAKPYALRAGDSVRVTYNVDPTVSEEAYRLQPGDTVSVAGTNPADPTQASQLRVLPDGTLSLPEVQLVDVAGQSIREARAALAERYAAVLRAPNIALALEDGTLEADLFLDDLGNGPGADKTLQILPDGTVTAPRIGSVDALGLTLGELAGRLDRGYAEAGLPLVTSVTLAQGSGWRTFVMGEVNGPGMLTTDRPLTVLMAVSMAGGPTTSAKTEGTRVLYVNEEGEPRLRFLDLDRLRDQILLEDDLVLPGDAVVYVPPSALTIANRYADQVVGQLGFFQGLFGSVYLLDLNTGPN